MWDVERAGHGLFFPSRCIGDSPEYLGGRPRPATRTCCLRRTSIVPCAAAVCPGGEVNVWIRVYTIPPSLRPAGSIMSSAAGLSSGGGQYPCERCDHPAGHL